MPDVLHDRSVDEVDLTTFYQLLALRVSVFVVEQDAPYQELDGRDLEPSTRHLWVESDGTPVAYLRTLAEPDGSLRVGRVCTAAAARGQGLAGRLVDRALAAAGTRAVVLDAQAHLREWYARWGFVASGPTYVEDGIEHVPMRRSPVASGR